MALRAGRVGVNSADVDPITGHIINSSPNNLDVAHKIGSINGKDVFEIYVKGKTPNVINQYTPAEIDFDGSDKMVLDISGAIIHDNGTTFPAMYLQGNAYYTSILINSSGNIAMYLSNGDFINKDLYVRIIYINKEE